MQDAKNKMQDARFRSGRKPLLSYLVSCILYPVSSIALLLYLLPEAGSPMTMRKRLLVMASLIVLASVFYGVAKYYSPSLIFYVVEQSLIQKAPAGMDPVILHDRFRAYISETPDKKSQMERLFRVAEYLEKAQHLTSEQLDELLRLSGRESLILPLGCSDKIGRTIESVRLNRFFLNNWNFFVLKDV